jgi:hypothetical protein
MSRRESVYERKERDFKESPSRGIPHLRPVLRADTRNVLPASQNLRRGWTTDLGPRFFDPTPPLLANAKTASDQGINERRRSTSPLNCHAMLLMLRRIAGASFLYPQIYPRTTAINGAQSQLGWGKGSGTFPDVLCAGGLDQCRRRTNGFGSRLEQANP